MIEVTNDSISWDFSEDREILKQFLGTRTGSRLIPKVIESCPTLLGKGDVNEILIRSGEVRGFQIAITALLALSVPEPETKPQVEPTSYPPLDDDAKWQDGQKVS